MTVVSINQPCYLPFSGYFDRIAKSDIHIVLDHVQLEKGGFTNRNRIMQPDGRITWLTIPVEHGKPINQTRVTDHGWQRKHRETIRQAYGEEAVDSLRGLFRRDWDWLDLACYASQPLSFLYRSAPLRLNTAKSELILDICRWFHATTYLSGPQGRHYLNIPEFEDEGIEVVYHDFTPSHDPPLSYLHDLYGSKRHCQQEHPRSVTSSEADKAAPVGLGQVGRRLSC